MTDLDEVDGASDSFLDRFLILACNFYYLLYIALILELMLLSLTMLSFLFADLTPGTRVVLWLDFLLLGVALAITGGGIAVCHRRAR